MITKLVTIQRHITEQQSLYPTATGEFTSLMWDFILATKQVTRAVGKAGLAEVLGATEDINISGDTVMKLDKYAQNKIFQAMDHGGHLCVMASEEVDDIIPIPEKHPKGKYVLIYDPLDGSSNIDVNISIGTIFSIHQKISRGSPDGTLEDCLQRGLDQVAAGYIIYGPSTMLVYTTGRGVHGFTYDPSLGEFLLSHENIKMPARGKIYSINEGNAGSWDEGTRNYINYLKQKDEKTCRPYSLRYVGTLVADFHRTLIYGGIFMYPASPKPKLRLLYEASPMAFLVEEAGGNATTGRERILEIKPKKLHQRVPLIIGSHDDVAEYEQFFQGKRK